MRRSCVASGLRPHLTRTASPSAADDMPDSERTRSTLQDLQDVRRLKLRTGIASVLKDVQRGRIPSAVRVRSPPCPPQLHPRPHRYCVPRRAQVTHASAMEIASIRPYLLKSLTEFYRYERMIRTGARLRPRARRWCTPRCPPTW